MKVKLITMNETTNSRDVTVLEHVPSGGVDFAEHGCYQITYNNGKNIKIIPYDRVVEIDIQDVNEKTITVI